MNHTLSVGWALGKGGFHVSGVSLCPFPKGEIPKSQKSLERGVSYIGVERGRKNERGNQSYKGGTFSITLTNFT